MNHRYLRELKALNIRDVLDKAIYRRSMGLFKANANFKGRLQAEELHSLVSFAYQNGYYKEFVKHEQQQEYLKTLEKALADKQLTEHHYGSMGDKNEQ